MNGERDKDVSRRQAKPQLDNILNELKRQAESVANTELRKSPDFAGSKAVPFEEKLQDEKSRKQKIENDIKENDQKLKEETLKKLFWFLGAETAVIFLLAFAQGFAYRGFHLDDWSFRLVITATLGQITAMLVIAVQHLFPKKK